MRMKLWSRLPTWMNTEKVLAFRIFSSEDPNKDYSNLDNFNIDTAVFFSGDCFFVFSDVLNKPVKHKRYESEILPLSQLDEWLKELPEDTTLMGYNSTKLDYQLLAKAFNINFKTIDLMDAVGLTGSEAFAISKRRYPMREVVRWNGIRQTWLPHFSWIFNSVELFEEWFNQRFRSVAKSLCAECEMVATFGHKLRRKKRVKLIDPDTGRTVLLPIDIYDHILPQAWIENPELFDKNEQSEVE